MTYFSISSHVLCPFYIKEDKLRVVCEGLEQGSKVHVMFASANVQKNYRARYCCDGYKDCLLYHALTMKYEDDEGAEK